METSAVAAVVAIFIALGLPCYWMALSRQPVHDRAILGGLAILLFIAAWLTVLIKLSAVFADNTPLWLMGLAFTLITFGLASPIEKRHRQSQ